MKRNAMPMTMFKEEASEITKIKLPKQVQKLSSVDESYTYACRESAAILFLEISWNRLKKLNEHLQSHQQQYIHKCLVEKRPTLASKLFHMPTRGRIQQE